MNLTENHKDQLRRSASLGALVQARIANRERLMWHNRPKKEDAKYNALAAQSDIDLFNADVDAWEKDKKFADFATRYFPKIQDAQGKDRLIFVLALSDFDYPTLTESTDFNTDISLIANAEYNGLNVVDMLIDQMFEALTFPPKKVEV